MEKKKGFLVVSYSVYGLGERLGTVEVARCSPGEQQVVMPLTKVLVQSIERKGRGNRDMLRAYLSDDIYGKDDHRYCRGLGGSYP